MVRNGSRSTMASAGGWQLRASRSVEDDSKKLAPRSRRIQSCVRIASPSPPDTITVTAARTSCVPLRRRRSFNLYCEWPRKTCRGDAIELREQSKISATTSPTRRSATFATRESGAALGEFWDYALTQGLPTDTVNPSTFADVTDVLGLLQYKTPTATTKDVQCTKD